MKPVCALIYNENSSGFNKKTFLNIIKAIYNSGYTPVPIESEYPEFIVDNIEEFNDEYNVILTMGGDGTVSNAYEAFHKLNGNQKALYGHVPSGTTNDMGPNTYVPRYNPVKATKALLKGDVENRDIIAINNKAIAYVATGGVLGPCTYLIDKSGDKKDAGTFSYIKYGAKKFFTDPELYKNIVKNPYKITVDLGNEKFDTETIFLAIFNAKTFSHLRINPTANMCDGKFNLAILHNESDLFKILPTTLLAKNGAMNYGKDNIFTTDYLKITFNDRIPYYPINCDGDAKELFGNSNTLEVKPQGKIKQLVRKTR